MTHKRSTALERIVKNTGGLKPVSQRANLTLSSDVGEVAIISEAKELVTNGLT